ncbi:MAG: hypothetical protein VB111_07890 [Clostridiaceae bacterium]|nr:hypothetical protein [Clostridiaceae bacterium]
MAYLFKSYDDPDYYHLIPQAGVRAVEPDEEGNGNFNTCWDGALSPDGVFYYTLSSEAGKCDHAKLVRYNYNKNAVEECVYMGNVVMPQKRQLPHSKFHTSINFRPKTGGCGYTVLGVTHNTDRAPQHTEWMPFAHHADIWEGFPGSQILMFDPDTGHAESWGTPVPRETIYGAKYDPAHDRLYMIGFMRGHVYSMDCKTRKVEDLGKAAEVFNYRLSLASDGNIYSCTKSGEYYRINTEKNILEDLHRQVPYYPGALSNNTHYRYLTCARMHPSGKFMYLTNSSGWELYQYDFETGEFTTAGRLVPGEGLFPVDFAAVDYSCGSFAVDKYGVIWYELRISLHKYTTDVRLNPYYSKLMRWDIENGKAPEYIGVMGTPERVHGITVEMEYDPATDRIYTVDHGTGFGHKGPCVLCIDLPEFRRQLGSSGAVSQGWQCQNALPVAQRQGPYTEEPRIYPRHASPEEMAREEARRKVGAGEQVTESNPFVAFPNRDAYPVRLWNAVLRPEDSEVIGMCYGEDGILHVVTGETDRFDEAKYVFRIRYREIESRADFGTIKEAYREWLRTHILPQPVCFDENIRLPEVTGRRYRAHATATAEWNGGRTIVGTRDAQLAVIDEAGEVFSLGGAAAYGPVRCMVTNAAKTKLWGVAGDKLDMGYVFSYDDRNGLRQLGMLNYDSIGFYRPSASNILSSVALSPDEHTLAIGGADRLGTVHVIDLKQEEKTI